MSAPQNPADGTPPPSRREAAELLRAACNPSKAGLWRAIDDDTEPDHVSRLTQLEEAATTIQAWHPTLIPGMLQTYAYAVDAIQAAAPSLPPEDVAERAAARCQRIDALGWAADRRAWFIVGEEVLTRPLSHSAALADQLEHLLSVIALRPAVTVQVLPRSSAGHPGLTGAFTRYTVGPQRAVFVETLTASVVTTRSEDLAAYCLAYDHLQASAASPAESLRMIESARRALCTPLKTV